MPLEYSCIMPHGGDIIPQLAVRKTEHLFEKTRESVRRIARDIRNARPQTIILASPHNLRLQDNIAIVTAENSSGQLKGPRGKKVSLGLKCDREFAQDLLEESTRKHLPVVGANYDEFVSQAIRKNRLESISGLSKKFVEDAKPDSLWQMAILAGLTRVVKMRGNLLSYEVPTYYGMICASFTRA